MGYLGHWLLTASGGLMFLALMLFLDWREKRKNEDVAPDLLSLTCSARPPFRNAQLGQLLHDVASVRRRAHPLVDVQDPPVRANEERPARGVRLIRVDDAVGGRDFL
jgi:hypothetical protein